MENTPTMDGTMAATFSLRMSHVAYVSKLVEWLGKNRSAVVQAAIEGMYQREAAKHTAEAQS